MGFILGQGAYFRSKWNIMEFAAALSGIGDFVDGSSSLTSQAILQIASVFRYF
jgi:hypothetical protein